MAVAADYLTIEEVNRSIWAFVHGGSEEVDPWLKIQEESRSESQLWPSLKDLYNDSIRAHDSLGSALANRLAKALTNSRVSSDALFQLFKSNFAEDRDIRWAIREDLRVVSEHHAPINSYLHTLLYSRCFLALEAHRVAHKLWSEGKGDMAVFIQMRVSDVFGVDVLPEEEIKRWMLIANATGVFDGNTVVVGNSVTIFCGKVYVYEKTLLAAERADHPAKLVRHKLMELYKVHSAHNDARKMFEKLCGKDPFLEFQGDVRKLEYLWWIAVGADAPKTPSNSGQNSQGGGVQGVQVDQADGSNGVVIEEIITDEESSLLLVSSQISRKNPGGFYHICPIVSPDVGSTASVSQPHSGESSEDGGGQVPDHQSNDPAASSPHEATQALRNTSSAAGQGERPPAPSGNSGDGARQPPRDVEDQVPLPQQPDDVETRLKLSAVANTCLVISGSVSIALPTIRFSTNKNLSGNVSLLLSSAEISSVAGFSLSLGGYISLQLNRRGAGLATRVLTGAGCAFTTCGFLLIMGTQLPENLMLWLSGVSCMIPITVIPFLFKNSA